MVNISSLVSVATPSRAAILYVCTDPAVQKAAREGRTVADVIRDALEEYIADESSEEGEVGPGPRSTSSS